MSRNTGWSQRDEYSQLGLCQEQLQLGGDSGARSAADHGRRRRRRSLVGSVGSGSGGSCGGLRVASVRGLGSWGGGWAWSWARAWAQASALARRVDTSVVASPRASARPVARAVALARVVAWRHGLGGDWSTPSAWAAAARVSRRGQRGEGSAARAARRGKRGDGSEVVGARRRERCPSRRRWPKAPISCPC